jgi:hypothetical protein
LTYLFQPAKGVGEVEVVGVELELELLLENENMILKKRYYR